MIRKTAAVICFWVCCLGLQAANETLHSPPNGLSQGQEWFIQSLKGLVLFGTIARAATCPGKLALIAPVLPAVVLVLSPVGSFTDHVAWCVTTIVYLGTLGV